MFRSWYIPLSFYKGLKPMNKDLYISRYMNGKMKDINSLSTNPLTNKYCVKANKNPNTICSVCYSIKSLLTYRSKNTKLYENNNELLSKHPVEKFNRVVTNSLYFRFNSHGELINSKHLYNLCSICWSNPQTTFSLWTKRKDIVKNLFGKYEIKKPKNLIIIYSNPKINKIVKVVPNEYFDKIFNNVDKDMFMDEQNCTGKKCIACLKCYTKDTTFDNRIIIEGVK